MTKVSLCKPSKCCPVLRVSLRTFKYVQKNLFGSFLTTLVISLQRHYLPLFHIIRSKFLVLTFKFYHSAPGNMHNPLPRTSSPSLPQIQSLQTNASLDTALVHPARFFYLPPYSCIFQTSKLSKDSPIDFAA